MEIHLPESKEQMNDEEAIEVDLAEVAAIKA